jgi:4-hydroxybenzoate polyprenyltransferase
MPSPDAAKARHLARLMRPENVRFSLLLLIVVGVLNHVDYKHLIFSGFLLFACYGIVTIQNDLADQEVDTTNHRQLPLVDGSVTKSEALGLLTTLTIFVGVLQFVLIQPIGLLFTLAYLVLGWAYSSRPFQLENHGLLATLALGTCYGALPIILGAPYNTPSLAWILAGSLLLSMSALLFKDFKDEVGDRLHGKLTPLVKYGSRKVKSLAFGFLVLGASCLYFYSSAPIIAVPVMVAAILLWRASLPPKYDPPMLALYKVSCVGCVCVSLTS